MREDRRPKRIPKFHQRIPKKSSFSSREKCLTTPLVISPLETVAIENGFFGECFIGSFFLKAQPTVCFFCWQMKGSDFCGRAVIGRYVIQASSWPKNNTL
ncbi:hypothetical protein XU18_3638 [Perkinsela sp. CCAP 1560/4]|nr:hypothetical protein XU18_3638 [Perkinsela sp. CCAP 1560/4]|eukprot:KNH05319.1 hypothetical protein XU18_3638 [Perkinsela sp. CCAP 1560/4]